MANFPESVMMMKKKKSGRMGWTAYVERMWEMRYLYGIFVGKH
jgi:hypothetical protein